MLFGFELGEELMVGGHFFALLLFCLAEDFLYVFLGSGGLWRVHSNQRNYNNSLTVFIYPYSKLWAPWSWFFRMWLILIWILDGFFIVLENQFECVLISYEWDRFTKVAKREKEVVGGGGYIRMPRGGGLNKVFD